MKWLDELILKTEKRIRANRGADQRTLRLSKRKEGYQYYLEDNDGRRSYVKDRDIETARKAAQREYDMKMHKKLLILRNRLERFIRLYDIEVIENEYNNMCEAKKILVTPVIPSDEEFVKKWNEDHKGNMNPFPETGRYLTQKGEYVRSKSEKILADLFFKNEIPYTYEPAVELSNGTCVYPDFALLNVRTRKTIFWEHFGLITDGEYAKKTLHKLSAYERSNIRIGEDLLFSMESETLPLDVEQIEKKIGQYLR